MYNFENSETVVEEGTDGYQIDAMRMQNDVIKHDAGEKIYRKCRIRTECKRRTGWRK